MQKNPFYIFQPDYGVAKIIERSISVNLARKIGRTANSRVNNASIVTRINCYGNSILICGDMEKEAWEFVLNKFPYSLYWRPLVSNVDILVAPHHGHRTGYSTALMGLAKPDVVLVSVASKDPSVDDRYSLVSGITVKGRKYKRITTRDIGDHVYFSISPPNLIFGKGERTWYTL